MNKATATPVSSEFFFQKENDPYILELKANESNIAITIRKNGHLPRKKYESIFSLQELLKKSKWFKMFDSCFELATEISAFINKGLYNIKEDSNIVFFNLQVELYDQNEISLIIDECQAQNTDILYDICQSMNMMNITLGTLTEKFDFLEKTIEYQRLLTKGELIANKKVLLKQKYEQFLSNWIINDTKGKVSFQLIYKGTLDGDNSDQFHNYCDNKGPTLTIIQTTKNHIFGGFTSLSWDQSNNYKRDPKAFLFSIDLMKFYPIKTIEYSMLGQKNSCVIFGGGTYNDILVLSNYLSSQQNSCHLSSYGDGNPFEFNGKEQFFEIKDLEVYKVIIINE